MGVAVIGQVGRDLVLRAAGMPEPGGSAPIVKRRDLLGGKGANQAVGLTQLGVPAALVGVVGDDSDGDVVLEQAAADGIDTTGVARRGTTALLVDLVDEPSSRRLFEDIPSTARVSVEDLERARGVLDVADTVSIQLQQPPTYATSCSHLSASFAPTPRKPNFLPVNRSPPCRTRTHRRSDC